MTKSRRLNIRYYHDKLIVFVAEVVHFVFGIHYPVYDLGVGDG